MSEQTTRPTVVLTFVSHTHWDREWYQPFEEFRVRLVQMMDRLLHVLDTDPGYLHFMLDGQTIVLGDYLAIRPEQEAKIMHYVQEGRIQIGPWHILPDEFLVGPESTVRNLLIGAQTCAHFGGATGSARMDVGNIPDPFGHISQLPQILRGFDMDVAVFWRGISAVQRGGTLKNEFIWRSPDGSEVLVIHQHSGYGNAAGMPTQEQAFIARVQQIIADLSPTATTPHLLAMNGTDHEEPMPELARLLAATRAAMPDVEIRHGTLPQFIADIRAAAPKLETVYGELRDCATAPLLPGVLSTRMWIKQRNAACETLLTAWAEPLAAIAKVADAPMPLRKQSALVKQAWRRLLQNHPHDSICGCSIDQVHKEMAVRFDRVEQIGERVAAACLDGLAALIDTSTADERNVPALVVFNPTTRPRSDLVQARIPLSDDGDSIVLVSTDGQTIVPQLDKPERDTVGELVVDVGQFAALAGQLQGNELMGEAILGYVVRRDGDTLNLEIRLGKGTPADTAIAQGKADLMRLVAEGQVRKVHIVLHRGAVAGCTFVAPDVPGLGYRTFWVRPAPAATENPDKPDKPVIENEFFRVQADEDGTCTLTDKETGTTYGGLNRFVDVGDRGDEYNFCPVDQDVAIQGGSTDPLGSVDPAAVDKPLVRLAEYGSVRQTLEVSFRYRVPAGLDETHTRRADERIDLPITTRISLMPGVRRVDIETTVENHAADHRLRVHFPVPVQVGTFDTEGHFDVITRSLDPRAGLSVGTDLSVRADLPMDTANWLEQPVPTHPQRAWADVSDGGSTDPGGSVDPGGPVDPQRIGLLVANCGLPEVEVLRTEGGVEIALTLLRCVGWLSRSDLSNRQGPAGPEMPTPEAQCPGRHTFHYALVPHAGDRQTALHQAYALNAPLRAAVTAAHTGALPAGGSFVQIEPASLVVSAIKEAEQGNGLIVRFWNTASEPCEATVKLWRRPARVTRCNLGERELEQIGISAADGTVRVSARGREIVTLRAEF